MTLPRLAILPFILFLAAAPQCESRQVLSGRFEWRASKPLVTVRAENLPVSPGNPWVSVKDPSIVRYRDRWHLFATLRKRDGGNGRPPGHIRIGYLSFSDWEDAPDAKWRLLDLTMGYHAAPQVFHFSPQGKWYLVYQCEDASRGLGYGACYSTTDDLSSPQSWTKPEPLHRNLPADVPRGLDHWIICDEERAYHFYTDLKGSMWRSSAPLATFPRGFGRPEVALRGDIFEASHTYRLDGTGKFLTLIEARDHRRRYYKAFLADRLDGEWKPLAATRSRPFARFSNVRHDGPPWTESYSHGELIRSGYDQHLGVRPEGLQFLFQGAPERGRWQLGLLSLDG